MGGNNKGNGLLTAAEVARLLKIEMGTVQLWRRLGVLDLYRNGNNGGQRYRREEVDSFLGRRGCPGTPAYPREKGSRMKLNTRYCLTGTTKEG